MALEWLNKFYKQTEKAPDYYEKTLAAYRLGMKGKGSIVGVLVERPSDCCEVVQRLPIGEIYDPRQARRLSLPGCSEVRRCRCVYRPVMSYQQVSGTK